MSALTVYLLYLREQTLSCERLNVFYKFCNVYYSNMIDFSFMSWWQVVFSLLEKNELQHVYKSHGNIIRKTGEDVDLIELCEIFFLHILIVVLAFEEGIVLFCFIFFYLFIYFWFFTCKIDIFL